jgi:hypothetical protein
MQKIGPGIGLPPGINSCFVSVPCSAFQIGRWLDEELADSTFIFSVGFLFVALKSCLLTARNQVA